MRIFSVLLRQGNLHFVSFLCRVFSVLLGGGKTNVGRLVPFTLWHNHWR